MMIKVLAGLGVESMNQVCPRCGSRNTVPIVYGEETAELLKKINQGEAIFGGTVTYGGMPTYKCRGCNSTFVTRQLTRTVLSSARLALAFILLALVGYFAGNATILNDSVVHAVILQVFSGSITFSSLLTDIVIWMLGLFAVVILFVIGIAAKRRTILWGGLGYTLGFLLSACFLTAWWTIGLEVVVLALFLLAYAVSTE
jgi:transposase-like protein